MKFKYEFNGTVSTYNMSGEVVFDRYLNTCCAKIVSGPEPDQTYEGFHSDPIMASIVAYAKWAGYYITATPIK